mmetsp:Transcript_19145/g.29944  ORF Transcript_19145/g.29944 Transcript_19145/m.29944 type:complete len:101 (-) Transcript_19145:160-462(-)
MGEVPSKTELSDRIAQGLKKDGFKFLGTTTVYSFLQACGFVNDHVTTCKCYHECLKFADSGSHAPETKVSTIKNAKAVMAPAKTIRKAQPKTTTPKRRAK